MSDNRTRNLLDAVHENHGVVWNVTNSMGGIGDAMRRLGMVDLANEIEGMIDALRTSEAKVNAAHGAELSATVSRTQQHTFDIVHATLAGIAVAGKAKP